MNLSSTPRIFFFLLKKENSEGGVSKYSSYKDKATHRDPIDGCRIVLSTKYIKSGHDTWKVSVNSKYDFLRCLVVGSIYTNSKKASSFS